MGVSNEIKLVKSNLCKSTCCFKWKQATFSIKSYIGDMFSISPIFPQTSRVEDIGTSSVQYMSYDFHKFSWNMLP